MSANDKIQNDIEQNINNKNDATAADQTKRANDNDQILDDVKNNTKLIKVLSQNLVIISVDKIRLAYTDHMSHRSVRDAWLGPAGILVSMLLTLLTASFSDAFGIAGATWKALFIFGVVSAGIWTAKLAYKAATSKPVDVESFIKKITVDEPNG